MPELAAAFQITTPCNGLERMDPERKDMMRRTLRQMRTMPPDARDRFMNSPTTQSHFSPEEMQMLRGFNSLGFVERDR